MHLALILAVLAALLSAETSPDVPVADVLGRLVAAAAAVAGVCLFAALSAGVTARRLSARVRGELSQFSRSENGGGLSRFSRSENGTVPFARSEVAPRSILRSYDRLRRLHLLVWLAAAGAILIGLDWARVVRANWGLVDAFLIDELLILAPVLLPLVLSWAAFYEVDRAVRLAAGSPSDVTMPGRWHYVALHARHYLGIVLAPVLAMAAVQDAAPRLCPQVIAQGREGLLLVPCLVAVILLFPLLLRYLWATEPLGPGPLREKLEKAAGRFGFRPRAIRVWRTGGMVANAAVAGFVGPLRYVFLSDGLIEDLRVLAMFLPFCLWLTAAQLFPHTAGDLAGWLGELGPSAGLPVGLLLLAALGAYLVFVFGPFSRLLEHQADLFACRHLEPPPGRTAVEVFGSALGKLVGRNGTGARGRSWQHAGLERRLALLRRLLGDARAERRFQRGLRWLGAGLVGLVLSPAVAGLLAL